MLVLLVYLFVAAALLAKKHHSRGADLDGHPAHLTTHPLLGWEPKGFDHL